MYNDQINSLGTFIADKRKQLGLTQNGLATKCDISRTEIVRIESGKRKQPSLVNLQKIAKNLFVPFDQLKQLANYEAKNKLEALSYYYPALEDQKQIEAIEKLIEIITSNHLNHEALDGIIHQANLYAAINTQV